MLYASRDDLEIVQFDPKATMLRVIGRRSGRRLRGRLPQEGLNCDLGSVLDRSAGGMRVLAKRPHHGELTVCVDGFEMSLRLQANIVWCKRHGLRCYEMGLQFLYVAEEMGRVLSRISQMHRKQRAIGQPPRCEAPATPDG